MYTIDQSCCKAGKIPKTTCNSECFPNKGQLIQEADKWRTAKEISIEILDPHPAVSRQQWTLKIMIKIMKEMLRISYLNNNFGWISG